MRSIVPIFAFVLATVTGALTSVAQKNVERAALASHTLSAHKIVSPRINALNAKMTNALNPSAWTRSHVLVTIVLERALTEAYRSLTALRLGRRGYIDPEDQSNTQARKPPKAGEGTVKCFNKGAWSNRKDIIKAINGFCGGFYGTV
ncbi:hypothetical protein FQN57_006620 [Myotisia sp. PD_48]|nr:hypothetical protein FQN57_006620 [Myotisia sp. PD_48]